MPLRRAILALSALSLVSLCARTGRAGTPQEQQLAQALFDEGRSLMEQKRFGEACPKLAESQRLDPGGGTLLNLALCHEAEGKLATAKGDYEEALRLAMRDGRADRQRIAREHLAGLEKSVPRIAVSVGADAAQTPGLEVMLDGVLLRREAWGVAAPVDPGTHSVEAHASGRAAWSSVVEVAPKERRTIEIPPLGPATTLPPAPCLPTAAGCDPSTVTVGGLGAAAHPREESPRPPTATVAQPRANPVFVGLVVGAGIAGATSLATGFVALFAYTSAKSGCLPDRDFCKDASSRDAASLAGTTAWISTISLGVAVVAVGAALFVPTQVTRSGSGSLRPAGSVGLGTGTVGIEGAF